MSLLTIVSNAMSDCGYEIPTVVIGNEDTLVKSFLSLATREVQLLSRGHMWSNLTARQTITGDGSTTVHPLDVDFYKFGPGNKIFTSDTPSHVLRMKSDEEFLEAQASTVTPLYPVWRKWGTSIEFYPAPASAVVYKFDYHSEYGVTSGDAATRRKQFAADDDYALVPEHLVELGVIWRYKRSIGLDYAEEMATYEREKMREMAADRPRNNVSLRRPGARIDSIQVAYPGVISV